MQVNRPNTTGPAYDNKQGNSPAAPPAKPQPKIYTPVPPPPPPPPPPPVAKTSTPPQPSAEGTKDEVTTDPKTGTVTEQKPGTTTESKAGSTKDPKVGAATESKPEVTTDPKTGAATEQKPGTTAEPKDGSTKDPKAGAAIEPKPEVTTDPKTGSATEQKPGTTAEPKAGSTKDPKAGTATESKPGPTSEPNAGNTTEPKTGTTAQPKPGATNESKPGVTNDQKPGTTTESKPGPTSEPNAGITTEPKTGTTAQPKPGATNESKSGDTNDQKPGTTTEPKPGPTSEPNAGTTTEPKTGTAAQPKPDATNESKPGVTNDQKSGTTTEPKPGPTSEPSADTTTEPKTGTAAQPKPDATNDPKPGVTTDPKTGTTTEPKPGVTSEPNTGTTTEPKTGTTAQPKPGATDDPKPGTTTESKPGVTNEPNTGTTTEPKTGTTAQPKPGATDDPKPGVTNDQKTGTATASKPGVTNESNVSPLAARDSAPTEHGRIRRSAPDSSVSTSAPGAGAAPSSSSSSSSSTSSSAPDPLAERRQANNNALQALTEQYPDKEKEAGAYAQDYLKQHFGVEVKDPAHTYLNEYERPGGDTVNYDTNQASYKQPPSSLPPNALKTSHSLTELFTNNFNPDYHQSDFEWPKKDQFDQYPMDLSKHQGLFGLSTSNASTGHPPPDQTSIDPQHPGKVIDPGDLFSQMTASPDKGGADFQGHYQQSLQSFFEKNGTTLADLTREHAKIDLETQHNAAAGQPNQPNALTEADYAMVRRAWDRSGQPGSDKDPHVYPLDVHNNLSPTAMRVEGSDGRNVLYMPKEDQPYQAFANKDQAQEWIEQQNSSKPGWGNAFAEHYFSHTAQDGLDSGRGVMGVKPYLKDHEVIDPTHTVTPKAEERNYLRQDEDISQDPFGRQTQRLAEQDKRDAYHALTSNSDRTKNQWINGTKLIPFAGSGMKIGLGKDANERGAGAQGLFLDAIGSLPGGGSKGVVGKAGEKVVDDGVGTALKKETQAGMGIPDKPKVNDPKLAPEDHFLRDGIDPDASLNGLKPNAQGVYNTSGKAYVQVDGHPMRIQGVGTIDGMPTATVVDAKGNPVTGGTIVRTSDGKWERAGTTKGGGGDGKETQGTSGPSSAHSADDPEVGAGGTFDQAGGHAESFVQLNNQQIAKMTTPVEANAYKKYGDPMAGVIPKHWEPGQLTPDQQARLAPLGPNSANKEAIVLEKLGGDIQKKNRRDLDVKIGSSTASKTELEDQGHPNPFSKKIRLSAADLLRGSRQPLGENRGFVLAGYGKHGEAQGLGRFELGMRSKNYIQDAMSTLPQEHRQANIQKILSDLRNIQRVTKNQPVTFVASSVFMAIDETNPAKTVARLIDLAHPIEKGASGATDFPKWQARFQEGLSHLIDTVYETSLRQ